MASRIWFTMNSEKIKFVTKIEEIEGIVKKISRNKNVKAVYLFGSYARGVVHVNSDIDLCIITKNNYEDVRCPASDNLDISFFHKLPISIQYRVFKEGKPLFIKDKNFVDRLKIKTLEIYLDFKPLINRFIWENFKCTI